MQLFSLLSSNPGLLDLLATILGDGAAPRRDHRRSAPHVLDALIEPAFFGRLPDAQGAGRSGSRATLAEARSYEDVLDRARIFGQEQAFLIGVRVLAGTIGARQAGDAYATSPTCWSRRCSTRCGASSSAAHGRMQRRRGRGRSPWASSAAAR